ncbi:MAG TPA: hypothetical protein VII11_12280 [Bacteroidota bacterium]
MNEPSAVLAFVRRILLVLFVFGALATVTELLLLEHTEDWQITPLLLLAASLVVLLWFAFSRAKASLMTFRYVMVLFLVGGITGITLHYNGNVEFELEMYPTLDGWYLFKKAIQGAFPALAPGMMIHLGLIGLAFTYRHPAFNSNRNESTTQGETR